MSQPDQHPVGHDDGQFVSLISIPSLAMMAMSQPDQHPAVHDDGQFVSLISIPSAMVTLPRALPALRRDSESITVM